MLMQGIMEPEFLTILLVNQLIKSNFTFSITGTPLSKLHQEVLWSSDAHLSPTKRKVHVLAALQLLVLCSSGKKVIELHSLVLVKVCIKFQFFALKSSALVSKQANAQLCQYYSEKKSSSGHKSSESWNYSSVNPLGFSSTLLQKSHENVRISFCLSNFSVSVSPDYYVSLNLTKKKFFSLHYDYIFKHMVSRSIFCQFLITYWRECWTPSVIATKAALAGIKKRRERPLFFIEPFRVVNISNHS